MFVLKVMLALAFEGFGVPRKLSGLALAGVSLMMG